VPGHGCTGLAGAIASVCREGLQPILLAGFQPTFPALNSPPLPLAPASADINEIVSCKLWLNMTAYVPLEKIRGFRAPYLVHNEQQRTILQQNGEF
jgi:hypothetical protein